MAPVGRGSEHVTSGYDDLEIDLVTSAASMVADTRGDPSRENEFRAQIDRWR